MITRAIRRRARQRAASAPLRSEPPPGVTAQTWRVVARQGADRTRAIGLSQPWTVDLYHIALSAPWWRFLLTAMALYVLTNSIFALLYLVQPDALANARPGNFWDAFFFSVQTIGTVGYGVISPATFYANVLVTIETATGVLIFALMTGLAFARFSRPSARMLFSHVAVIGPHNGAPTLSLRLANQRRNQILQAEVDLSLLRDERTIEGDMIRRFYDLQLARRRSPVFAMTFTVLHEIDENSPLYGATAASLEADNAELVVTASGIDETIAQRVHARASYLPSEILWNRRLVDVIGWTDDGCRVIDYRRFHDTEPVAGAR